MIHFKHTVWVPALLAVHLILLSDTIWTYSITVDEGAHLPAGLSHWRFGRLDLYRVNPPLVDTVAAVPLLFGEFKEDWEWYSIDKNTRREFFIGKQFVDLNGSDSLRLYRYGRLACIPFTLIGAISVYWFGRRLYGATSGIVAMCLWCCSPNVLGNAAIITPDVGGAALAILAAFAFWRWMSCPDWSRTLVAGLTLGLAELAKSTCVIFYVLWPVIWIISRRAGGVNPLINCDTEKCLSEGMSNPGNDLSTSELATTPSSGLSATFSPCQGRRDYSSDVTSAAIIPPMRRMSRHAVGQLIAILVLGVYVTNLGYLFDGSFQQLKDYQFVSHALGGPTATPSEPNNRFRDSILGSIPVPFPVDYIHGIDLQKLDFEGERWSYAGGVQQKRGWWWWYLYAIVVKVPHGTMILVVMAGVASWIGRGKRTTTIETMASGGRKSPDEAFVVDDVYRDAKNEENIRGLTSPARRDWMVLIPAVCILVLVSSQTGFSRYFRYLLPAFPFVFVWASRVAQPHLLKRRWWKGLVAFALLWNVWSCVKVHPHHLAFFNEASGGSDNGHWHLLDANVDWGQANLALKHWVDERAEQVGRREPVYLSCFGVDMGMKLEDLGLNGKPVPMKLYPETRMNKSLPISELPAGLYAISVNHLHAYRHHKTGDPDCSEFLKLKPIAIVGSAIQIFKLPAGRDTATSASGVASALRYNGDSTNGTFRESKAQWITWQTASYRQADAYRSPTLQASEAATHGTYKVRTHVAIDGQSSGYLLFLPNSAKPRAGYPVIMFLNGFGENGVDGIRQVSNNFGVDVYRYRQTFPFKHPCTNNRT